MDAEGRREGDRYRVSPEERERFLADGYVHLAGVLSEEELAPLEELFERLLSGAIPVPERDFCDMSGDYERDPADFAVVNVMLPRRYHPPLAGNLFERRAASIAEALAGPGLGIDYDQILAKRPRRADAVFPWHQDLAYWPVTPDTRTATLWLALDDATVANGCMRFVPGSHREPRLREHRPLHGDRGASHTLVTEVDEARDPVRHAPIRRGDVTVHCERVLHGSDGNRTDGWRRAYVLAFRAEETIAEERRLGFTHSHNDAADVLGSVGEDGP